METIDEQLRLIRAELAAQRREAGGPPQMAVRFEKAATMLDVSPSTVKRLVARNDLIPVKILGRKVIPVSEITRYLSENGTPSVSSPGRRLPAKAPRPRRAKGYDAKTEAEKLREPDKPRRRKR